MEGYETGHLLYVPPGQNQSQSRGTVPGLSCLPGEQKFGMKKNLFRASNLRRDLTKEAHMKGNHTALKLALSASLLVAGVATSWAAEPAGQANYQKLCVSCHGKDGKGNPAMAKAMGEKGLNLTTAEAKALKDDDILKIITEGKGKMPASAKSLTKQEQQDLVSYTKSLAK
jgi:mono/diheme cytochrome c family protein